MFNLPTKYRWTGLFMLEFGDIVNYFSPYTAALFVFALIFTVLAIVSRPERQVDIAFGGDAPRRKGSQRRSDAIPALHGDRLRACHAWSDGERRRLQLTLFASLVGSRTSASLRHTGTGV